MVMATSSGTSCEIDVEVDSPNRNITLLDLSGECLESGDGAKQEIKTVRDEGVAASRSSSRKLFRYVGRCWSGEKSSPEQSWYYSECIQCKGCVSQSDVESKIESSKVHWSQVEATKLRGLTQKTNREYFEALKRRKYVREGDEIVGIQCIDEDEVPRFSLFQGWDEWNGLEVDEKLAEGGQAEIYTVKDHPDVVVKVFKEGSVLQQLEKQWPLALLKHYQFDRESIILLLPSMLKGATLLRSERLGWEDRFAFVMPRYWGDLRTLIDLLMIRSHKEGPPFSPKQVRHLMKSIAWQMMGLHSAQPPILHKDLKAANILVQGKVKRGWGRKWNKSSGNDGRMYDIVVADYECSVGVVGTGFWRAPEILQQLKHKVPASRLVFSEKCDVYSYGMMCYELVTGRIPLENYQNLPREGCDFILKGERPKLPSGLDGMIEDIITSCWDPIPSRRPTFEEICQMMYKVEVVRGGSLCSFCNFK